MKFYKGSAFLFVLDLFNRVTKNSKDHKKQLKKEPSTQKKDEWTKFNIFF